MSADDDKKDNGHLNLLIDIIDFIDGAQKADAGILRKMAVRVGGVVPGAGKLLWNKAALLSLKSRDEDGNEPETKLSAITGLQEILTHAMDDLFAQKLAAERGEKKDA